MFMHKPHHWGQTAGICCPVFCCPSICSLRGLPCRHSLSGCTLQATQQGFAAFHRDLNESLLPSHQCRLMKKMMRSQLQNTFLPGPGAAYQAGAPQGASGAAACPAFDDPSISTDLDKEEEAHAQEGLEDYVEHHAGKSRGRCSCQQQAGPLCLGGSQTQ